MMRTPLLVAAALLAWCAAPVAVSAQTCGANSCSAVNRVSVTVPKMMRLTVGSPKAAAAEAAVRSNTAWRLEISRSGAAPAAVVTGGSTAGAWQRVDQPATTGEDGPQVVRYTLVAS